MGMTDDYAESRSSGASGNESMGEGKPNQQELVRVMTLLIMGERVGDWRDQKELESRYSEFDHPVAERWRAMPKMGKDFHVESTLPDPSGPEVYPTDDDPESSGGNVDDLPIF